MDHEKLVEKRGEEPTGTLLRELKYRALIVRGTAGSSAGGSVQVAGSIDAQTRHRICAILRILEAVQHRLPLGLRREDKTEEDKRGRRDYRKY